jgi:hypothetical protein
MSKDLTNSPVDRQNILNNSYALLEVEKAIGLRGIPFEGGAVVLKEQVADFLGVTTRTVDSYLERFGPELTQNGYEVIRGKRLQELKLRISQSDAHEANFASIQKTSQMGIFPFRAFLNLAMVVAESDRAKLVRQLVLDIVIDTINQRTGGRTKYINQRDEEFLQSAFIEENYRKQFTDALRDCVDMGNFKYALYTDRIYVSIFREKSKEYRSVLKLEAKDRVRATFYSEVLDLIASFENGLAHAIRDESVRLGRKLRAAEVDAIISQFEAQPLLVPLVEKARNKMASRDLAFRDALHLRLKEYITPLQREDFERFLGDKSKELAERLEEAKDVMKRLKERE